MDLDRDLLSRWREGDKQAGNDLFDRHFRSVRRFFVNKVGAEDVQDLVQRTFLGCLKSIDRFRGDSAFRTYLFGIARNELLMHLRRRNPDRKIDFEVSSLHELGPSPSSVVAKHREHLVLLACLQRLPLQQQTLLELHYWEDIPTPELAEVFGVAPATIRTWLFRARAKLRDELTNVQWSGPIAQIDETVRSLVDLD